MDPKKKKNQYIINHGDTIMFYFNQIYNLKDKIQYNDQLEYNISKQAKYNLPIADRITLLSSNILENDQISNKRYQGIITIKNHNKMIKLRNNYEYDRSNLHKNSYDDHFITLLGLDQGLDQSSSLSGLGLDLKKAIKFDVVDIKSSISYLYDNDIVSFNIVTNKAINYIIKAIHIKMEQYCTREREYGIICKILKNGHTFYIRSFNRNEVLIYIHSNEILKYNQSNITIGTELEFNVIKDNKGLKAIRANILKKVLYNFIKHYLEYIKVISLKMYKVQPLMIYKMVIYLY